MKRILLTALTLLCAITSFAQNATITGIITDAEFKDFLIGTAVFVKGSTKGTIADVNGSYTLNVPAGKNIVQYSFLGYVDREVEVDLAPGEVKVINLELKSDSNVLEGVVVSAQAKGQQAAINSQLRSTGIINAVSVEKLSELPDVNVADAIGRLPGLMIQRDGGEGQKIIIRGLSPKYNTVAINGMNAPATGENDRSTDLNMISPDMIAGAEVMKANTADKDADGLGGTVNLIMKDAPHGFRLSVNGESGYHSQINGIGRFKAGLNASNRFFNDKLGVIFGASIDRTDRSNDTFSASYDVVGTAVTPGYDYTHPYLVDASIQSNLEKRTRSNLTFNWDYDLGNGNKIKMSNILSELDRDRSVRRKRYRFTQSRLRYGQSEIENHTTNLSNVLQGDFNFWGSNINVGAGHSAAWMNNPKTYNLNFYYDDPFKVKISQIEFMEPYNAISPEYVSENNLDEYYLYDSDMTSTKTYEREISAWLDWKTPFNFGSAVSGYVKLGGKYRQKNRSYETTNFNTRFDLSTNLVDAMANMPDLIQPVGNSGHGIAITNFLDESYVNKGNFLNGFYPNCSFDFALDPSLTENFYDKQKGLYQRLWSDMVERDYSGLERMYAAYIMSEINIGEWLTFIPGVRYDYSYLKYRAYSGTNVSDEKAEAIPFEVTENEDSENFGYLLPQIHLRIKPTDWMDIRLAYTKTLSRPDFNYLAPRTVIRQATNSITWSRTNLKPIISTNYDATISFYPNNWGLFTISGFYKDIENFIYERTAILHKGSTFDPADFELDNAYENFTITFPTNSPTRAMIMGVEVDAQAQFHQMHNWMKGLVLNLNFTLMDSGMDYHASTLSREIVNGKLVSVYNDVAYRDRLVNQPSFLVNASVGYDYKKFSGRLSCNYQDGVLVTAQQRSDAADKELTAPFLKLDAQFKYSVNKKLALFLNMSNLSFAKDIENRFVTGYPEKVEYYGATAYLGIKYDIFK